jgi:AraC-like DNA-binding protein
MVKSLKYFSLPKPLIDEQKVNPLTSDLYLTEIGEIEVEKGTIWDFDKILEYNLLVFCTKGSGIVEIHKEQIPVSGDQFFVIPKGDTFKFYSVADKNTRFLVVYFDGKKVKMLSREFSVVRNLIPSVNNLVANREMLFEEIFNNLNKGFHDENLEYVNFCLGHLLATFIYANRTSEDMADESNPLVRRAIDFMNKNIGRKLTLQQISNEVGYSPTYFTTLFKKETNYSPLSYFSHLKILKATEFLDYTRQKVKEISFTLGYSDPYYFTKDFKKKMGMSPRQYRNRVV